MLFSRAEFSVLALLTLWVGQFFVVGSVLRIEVYLAVFLEASIYPLPYSSVTIKKKCLLEVKTILVENICQACN